MNPTDYWTLALTTAIIAGALVLEHVAVGQRGWAPSYYYAMGLVTDLGLLLAWAAIRHVTVSPVVAVAIFAAACLAGVPDFLLLIYEDRQRARDRAERKRAWQSLASQHHKLAGELALLKVTGDGHRYSRAHNLLESVVFLRGGIHQDLADLQLLVGQLEPLLSTILDGSPLDIPGGGDPPWSPDSKENQP